MIDILCWRDRAPKRETRIVNILWFIQKMVWKVRRRREREGEREGGEREGEREGEGDERKEQYG